MRSSIRRTWRSVTFSRAAAATCVRCRCCTSCNTLNRSRSRWLKVIRSVSMGPSALHESGHFYFAQTGHSHFAATLGSEFVVSRAGEAYDARARGPNPEFPDEAHKRAHMCCKLTPDHEESFSCNRPSRRKIRTSIEPQEAQPV